MLRNYYLIIIINWGNGLVRKVIFLCQIDYLMIYFYNCYVHCRVCPSLRERSSRMLPRKVWSSLTRAASKKNSSRRCKIPTNPSQTGSRTLLFLDSSTKPSSPTDCLTPPVLWWLANMDGENVKCTKLRLTILMFCYKVWQHGTHHEGSGIRSRQRYRVRKKLHPPLFVCLFVLQFCSFYYETSCFYYFAVSIPTRRRRWK